MRLKVMSILIVLVLICAAILTYPYLLFHLGNNYFTKNDFKKAIKLYSQAESLGFDGPKLFMHRGITYLGDKNIKMAVADLNKSIQMNENNPIALVYLGIICSSLNNYKKAEDYYSKAIQYSPKSFQAYSNRGIANSITGDFEAAEKDFKKSLEINPEFSEGAFNLAKLYDQLNQIELALKYYNLSLKHSKPNMTNILDYANRRIISLEKLNPKDIPEIPFGVFMKSITYGISDMSMSFNFDSSSNTKNAK